MSAPREPDPCPARVHRTWRGAALVALAIATFATATEGKVIWDGATPMDSHRRDGARERCRWLPLFRAAHLARREAFAVQKSGAPFVPYVFAPYPLVVPALPSEWLRSGHAAGARARQCEAE
jgi:hypothetical protein